MRSHSKTVVVVDDSETFVVYIATVLTRMGFEVLPVENGVEAMKLLRTFPPDAVLLDVDMPVMDGVSTLKQIKGDEELSHIPIIMVSSDASKETYEQCVRLRCSGYLTKPVDINDLNDILQECISYSGGKKRKFLRAPFNEKVSLVYKNEKRESLAISLSEGGIYIKEINPLPSGSNVKVTIPLGSEKRVSFKGTVIYTKSPYGDVFRIAPGMGIEFQEQTSYDAAMLRAYITELLAGDIVDEQEESLITFDRKGTEKQRE